MFMWQSTTPVKLIFYPNLTAKNPALREFFNNEDVRHALSVAVNRDEINDVVHFGLGEPRQCSMWPTSKYYSEGDEIPWAQYDPDLANQLLDDAGYGVPQADERAALEDRSASLVSELKTVRAELERGAREWMGADQRDRLDAIAANTERLGSRLRALHAEQGGLRLP